MNNLQASILFILWIAGIFAVLDGTFENKMATLLGGIAISYCAYHLSLKWVH